MTVPLVPNYPAIDINCCFSTGAENDPAPSKGLRTDLPFLKAEYARLDIIASVHSTYAAAKGGAFVGEENLRLHSLIREETALFQWVVIEPNDPSLLQQAEAMLRSPKVLGIRLPASTRRQSVADYADELLAFAEAQGAAVMVQPSHILEIVPFAEKYANVNVIVPQLCTERLDKECLAECIAQTSNLYTDTSGSPATLNNSLEYVVDICGADRVLFGTGGESLAFEKARVLLSTVSREAQKKILLHNALGVFPKLAAWLDSRKEVPQ